MKRYDLTYGRNGMPDAMEEAKDGDWVRFEEIQHLMDSEVCPNCDGKGATAPNGVKYCNCPEEPEREPDSFLTLGINERDFLPSEYLK